jgi:hypothetical protein
MMAHSERVLAEDAEAADSCPIELVTENGHSIIRSWEINDEPAPTSGPYAFVIRTPNGLRETVYVEIALEIPTQIELHTCGRILRSNSFWIFCAERHLAAHLAEHDNCPRDGRLRVETLTLADMNLSIRWERT